MCLISRCLVILMHTIYSENTADREKTRSRDPFPSILLANMVCLQTEAAHATIIDLSYSVFAVLVRNVVNKSVNYSYNINPMTLP